MRAHDLRLLAPAATAWVAAWLATGATDAAVPAWIVPAVCWGLTAVALMLLVGGRAASMRRGVAAPLLLAAACASLVATVAGAGLLARQGSELADAARTRESVRLTVRLDAALRPATTAPWDEGESVRARTPRAPARPR